MLEHLLLFVIVSLLVSITVVGLIICYGKKANAVAFSKSGVLNDKIKTGTIPSGNVPNDAASVNIIDYGADPTGTNDSTKAIEDALKD